MTTNGAGADYLTRQKIAHSDFGARVADMLDDLYQGLYHIPGEVSRGTWHQEDWAEIVVGDSPWWATYDGSLLTQLVFLAHDAGIRVEIEAAAHRWLRLIFHPRERAPQGGTPRHHPTLQEAVNVWKSKQNMRPMRSKSVTTTS